MNEFVRVMEIWLAICKEHNEKHDRCRGCKVYGACDLFRGVKDTDRIDIEKAYKTITEADKTR